MPDPLSHIVCQSQAALCSDELVFSVIQRPGSTGGGFIATLPQNENTIENWTGQNASPMTLAQLVNAVPVNGRLCIVGAQVNPSLRQALVSKGLGVTIHHPTILHPHGAILFQSQMVVFDDMLTF